MLWKHENIVQKVADVLIICIQMLWCSFYPVKRAEQLNCVKSIWADEVLRVNTDKTSSIHFFIHTLLRRRAPALHQADFKAA